MKLWPVTKIDKGNKPTSKTYDDEIVPATSNVIVIFPTWTNLEQLGYRIPNPYSVKLTISFIVTFYLTKNWKQNLKISILAILFIVEVLFFSKKCWFFCKISKIKKVSVLKGIFSENTYVWILIYLCSSY